MDHFSYQNLVNSSQGNQILPSHDRTHVDPRLINSSTFNLQSHYEPAFSQKLNDEVDRQFIGTWLMEKGKLQPSYAHFNKPNLRRSETSICTAKKSLKQCLNIIRKLDSIQEDLRSNVDNMSTAEWKQKTLEIGSWRDEFDKLMTRFEDKASLGTLKMGVKRRAKKRWNQKKKKEARRTQQALKDEKRVARHKIADQWLESMKEETERVKMEEKLKKDADCVLYEVRKKKSEARKQLSLITALVKLRTVRDNMAAQRGERLSLDDRKAFGSVTEKLIRMWENSLQNYSKEEQCLQLMLEHNATVDSKAAKLAKESNIVEEWRNVLFGPQQGDHLSNPTYWALTGAERDLETFIAIRKSWDTFLASSNNKSGSSIPLGWVIPPPNPIGNWIKHLKCDS